MVTFDFGKHYRTADAFANFPHKRAFRCRYDMLIDYATDITGVNKSMAIHRHWVT